VHKQKQPVDTLGENPVGYEPESVGRDPPAPRVRRYPVVRLAASEVLVDCDTDLPQQPFVNCIHDREAGMS
jgi:hypothetical protein